MDAIIIKKLDEIKQLLNKQIPDKWLTMIELKEYTGLSESTIRRAIQRGVLKVSNKTGKNLFKISWVDRWLDG